MSKNADHLRRRKFIASSIGAVIATTGCLGSDNENGGNNNVQNNSSNNTTTNDSNNITEIDPSVVSIYLDNQDKPYEIKQGQIPRISADIINNNDNTKTFNGKIDVSGPNNYSRLFNFSANIEPNSIDKVSITRNSSIPITSIFPNLSPGLYEIKIYSENEKSAKSVEINVNSYAKAQIYNIKMDGMDRNTLYVRSSRSEPIRVQATLRNTGDKNTNYLFHSEIFTNGQDLTIKSEEYNINSSEEIETQFMLPTNNLSEGINNLDLILSVDEREITSRSIRIIVS